MKNKIDVENWPRKEHFEYYTKKLKCSYSSTISLDVTHFKDEVKKRELKYYPTFIWCVAKVVNSMIEFRMCTDEEGNPCYWDYVNPSYTIFHDDDNTFSDLWSYYDEDFNVFYKNIINDINTYKDKKGVKIKPDQPPNFFCLSCSPWTDYTAFSTIGQEPCLFPIISFGKITQAEDKYKMPFTVTIGHASADGYHTGKLMNDLQEFINKF